MTDMVAPPGYTDALQDVVVSQEANTALQEEDDKETEEEREMVEVPLDENEVSFMTPLISSSPYIYTPSLPTLPSFYTLSLTLSISFLTRLKMIVLHSILER